MGSTAKEFATAIATPQDNMGRFRAKLSALQLGRPFVHWRQAAEYARELENLLEDLWAGVADPRTGTEMVASFYQADSVIFANCDDSNGDVGDLFRYDARDLFVAYASRCADKEWLGAPFWSKLIGWRQPKAMC